MDNPGNASILRGMESDLLIIGGGLNGPALALAAARSGITATVIDALPRETRAEPGFDGRSYALALASQRLLAALGLWDALAANAQPMTEIKVSDGRVGDAGVSLGLHFESAEIEEGPMGHMVEDRHLRRALLDAMDATDGVAHLPGVRVTSQETGSSGVSVTLEDGRVLSGRLLVGADGRQSGTAERRGHPAHRLGLRADRTGLRHRA